MSEYLTLQERIEASRKQEASKVEVDSVEQEQELTMDEIVSQRAAEHEVYEDIKHIVDSITSKDPKVGASIFDVIYDAVGDDEEAQNDFVEAIGYTLDSMGVSDATLDDLFSEDEEVAKTTFDQVSQYLNEEIGDVATSIVATELMLDAVYGGEDECDGESEEDCVDSDTVEADQAFFDSKSKCEKDKDGSKMDDRMKCVKSVSSSSGSTKNGYRRRRKEEKPFIKVTTPGTRGKYPRPDTYKDKVRKSMKAIFQNKRNKNKGSQAKKLG